NDKLLTTNLLNILDQFANLLERALDFDDFARNFDVAGLGADGVGLAKHLLGEELQLAAGAFRLVHDVQELIQVARQADDLFGDVAALGEHAHFLDELAAIDLDVDVGQQGADAVEQAVAKGRRYLGNPPTNALQTVRDRVAVDTQLLGHGLAFLEAHGLQS